MAGFVGIYAGSADYTNAASIASQLGFQPWISDYCDATSPAVMAQNYQINQWAAHGPAGAHYVFGVPMLWTGNSGTTSPPGGAAGNAATQVSAVLAGTYDSQFTTVFNALYALDHSAIVRLGWEANGGNMAWSVESYITAANFISLFQHVAALAHTAGLKVMWNPVMQNTYEIDVTTCWPDPSFTGTIVDVFGPDMYMQQYEETANPTEPSFWADYIISSSGFTSSWAFTGGGVGQHYHCLTWYLSYFNYLNTESGHTMTFCIPETGCWSEATSFPNEGGTGDDPYYVSELAAWLTANDASVVLWCRPSGGMAAFFSGSNPNATAQVLASFGASCTVTGLNPTSGVQGTTGVTVLAQGFAANSALTVKVGGVTASITAGGTTTTVGSSTVTFTIPSLAYGSSYSVTVEDASSNLATCAVQFTVTGAPGPTGPVSAFEVRTVADSLGAPNPSVIYEDTGIVQGAGGSQVMTFPTNDITLHVQVRVQVAGLWSPWADSGAVSVLYAAPAQPLVSATPSNQTGSISVVIVNPTPTGDDTTTVYNDIYRFRTDQGVGTAYRVATQVSLNTAWVDYTPASGYDWQYQAIAFDALGNSTPSTWAD